MRRGPVEQSGRRRTRAGGPAEDRGAWRAPFGKDHVGKLLNGCERIAEDAAAERVENAELGFLNHLARQRVERQGGRKRRQFPGSASCGKSQIMGSCSHDKLAPAFARFLFRDLQIGESRLKFLELAVEEALRAGTVHIICVPLIAFEEVRPFTALY